MKSRQLTFYFDSSKCSGCKACQIACKDKHNLEVGILWRRVYEVTGGDWIKKGNAWSQDIKAYNISLSCNHCEDPICVQSCPTTAMHKTENGVVLVDESKCIGCQYCSWACPYGAPKFNKVKGVMTKCTFCSDYLEEGKDPACVAACPMRVLLYGDKEIVENKFEGHSSLFPLPSSNFTNPAIVISPHKDSFIPESHLPNVNNEEEV